MSCPGENSEQKTTADKKLDKMWELRDCKEVLKAFQINIKLTFLGTNPTREQIHLWWEAEKEARLSLLSAAIKTNRELIK